MCKCNANLNPNKEIEDELGLWSMVETIISNSLYSAMKYLKKWKKKGYQGRQKVESRVKHSESQFGGGGRKRLSFFLYPWAGKIGKKREREAIA